MTDAIVSEFPELTHQLREARRAHALLEQVVAMLAHAKPDEPPGEHAQRLQRSTASSATARPTMPNSIVATRPRAPQSSAAIPKVKR